MKANLLCYAIYSDELRVYNLIEILKHHDKRHLKRKEDMMVRTDTLHHHSQARAEK